MKLLGQWQTIRTEKLSIAMLPMRWNGIMDRRLNLMACEMSHEGVAVCAPNDEEVPHMAAPLSFDKWQQNMRILNLTSIAIGNPATHFVLPIQIREFYRQERGLDFIESTIQALMIVEVLSIRSIVAQGTQETRQLCIIGRDPSAIAQSAKIFGRIKTESCRMSEGARFATFQRRPMSLRGILEEQKPRLIA